MDRPLKKLALIACQALEPELEAIVCNYPNVIQIEFHELGLHDDPADLRQKIQQSIDACEAVESVQTIALGYGLCSKSIEGLATKHCELVIPRVHDCRAIMLGSQQRFEEYESSKPGTYWFSPGWLLDRPRVPSKEKFDRLLAEYTQKYGSDNAEYLLEMENDWIAKYSRAVYVDTGSPDVDEHRCFTRSCASGLGWEYDELSGSASMLDAMLSCRWAEDEFVVLEPGFTPKMVDDDRVFIAVPKD